MTDESKATPQDAGNPYVTVEQIATLVAERDRLWHENKICRELITNVRYWISRGCSETAVREIDAALARIREALGRWGMTDRADGADYQCAIRRSKIG